MITESAQASLAILRDPSNFQWSIIPLFTIVLYVYAKELDKQNWSRLWAAVAFWGMDMFNEVWNGLVFYFSDFAPVWGIAGDTSFLIFMGLNVEITFMFAITGIMSTYALPQDKKLKWFGVNNRIVIAVINSIAAVFVEVMLNKAGVLVWEWPWWNADAPWLIFLLGYMPFFMMCYWVYDMASMKKQAITVGTILSVNALLIGIGLSQGML